jgi:CRP-like cAMP-binding protein
MAQAFYVVLDGGLRLVEHTAEGKAVHLKLYGQGDVVGLLAVSGAYPYPAGAEAICNSTVASITGAETRQLILEQPSLALLIIDMLVNHVHGAHARLRQMASERVEQRLARTLIHYAEKFGHWVDNELSIDVPLSQQALADFVGTALETINRTLSKWEKQGWIRISRQHIDILQPLVLHELVDSVAALAEPTS